jgi:sugar phosphate isomerase/epimerase
MVQDRRTFLATFAGAALGLSRHTVFAQSPRTERTTIQKIGIQLYTVRRQAAADLGGTLERLGRIGFKEVELAGYYNHSAAEFRDLLKRSGLTAPSGHIAIELIDTNPAKTFDDAHTVGHEWIVVPSLPRGRRETEDDWKRIASQFNAAAAKARAAGFRFAFHNHTDVIKPVNGIVPIDVLMRETDRSLVSFEMDIYWAVSGGADPLALLAKHPGRFRMLHVKDGKPPYTDASQTDLGQGTIDFKPIIARAKGVEHYFIESDSAADPLAFAQLGHKYLANVEY